MPAAQLGDLSKFVRARLRNFWQAAGDPAEYQQEDLTDWLSVLGGFPIGEVTAAYQRYLIDPKSRTLNGALRKPDPGAIRSLIVDTRNRQQRNPQPEGVATGDKTKLSFDERELLENKILPTARRWLNIPNLAEQGRKTLAYWGEAIPEPDAEIKNLTPAQRAEIVKDITEDLAQRMRERKGKNHVEPPEPPTEEDLKAHYRANPVAPNPETLALLEKQKAEAQA